MSMLSSQYNNLQESAHELSMFAGTLTAPYVPQSTKWSMRSTMLNAAKRMEEAADTICCLREKNLENLKLRELVLQLYKVTQTLRCNEVDNWYCQSECPLGIGKDGCTITELADKAKELGIDVFLD